MREGHRDITKGVNSHIEGARDITRDAKGWVDGVNGHQVPLNEDPILRMYAILRGDLEMTSGKAASQIGHAFKLLTKNILEYDPQIACEYFADGMGTNVCLIAKNELALERAYEQAIAAGLFCELVIDEHHIMPPHFTGEPILTAIGIGPCRRDEIHHITKRFNCMK